MGVNDGGKTLHSVTELSQKDAADIGKGRAKDLGIDRPIVVADMSNIAFGGLISFVSGAVLGVTIGSVINLGSVIGSILLDGQFRYFTLMLLLCANPLFVLVFWAFFKWWHPSALRDSLITVPLENLGLGFGFLGMQVLTGIMYEASASDIACVVLLQAAFLLCPQLLYYNNRTMEGANNAQS